jgi:hypothetical protein
MQVEENYHKYEARGGAHVDLVAETSKSANMPRKERKERKEQWR